MTRESGPLTEAGTPENSVVTEAPPPTVRLQISAAKKLNLAAFQNAVAHQQGFSSVRCPGRH
jgi:hypothetical protein